MSATTVLDLHLGLRVRAALERNLAARLKRRDWGIR
jgi:hypothetical protein